MKFPPKTKTRFFQISAILILVAAIIFYVNPDVAKYMMIVGVSGYGACVFTTPYPGKSLRGKRLFNMQVFAVILMAVSAFLMCWPRMEWVVALLVSAILTLYSTYAMSLAYKQEQEDNSRE